MVGVRITEAVICVHDSSAGIEPAVLETLFEPFAQGPKADSFDQEGTWEGGMGLGFVPDARAWDAPGRGRGK
jgi:signal transduction histidine kinase